MKRVPVSANLYERVTTLKTLVDAWSLYNARRPVSRRVEFDLAKCVRIHKMMMTDFPAVIGRPSRTPHFEGGKWRILEIPSFEATIVMTALWIVCGPYVEARIPDQSFSSRLGKGGHLCAKRCERFVHQNADGDARYCWDWDISKFYAHILKRVIMNRISAIFKDRRIIEMFRAVVYSTPDGLPIGYPFSHALANLYLTPLYHLLASMKGVSKIFVYMDNWHVFSATKAALKRARKTASAWLAGVGCSIKHNWQIFPTAKRGVHVCGIIIFAHRKSILFKGIWHRTLHAFERYRKNPTDKLLQSVMSRKGWLMMVNQLYNPAFLLPEGGYLWQGR